MADFVDSHFDQCDFCSIPNGTKFIVPRHGVKLIDNEDTTIYVCKDCIATSVKLFKIIGIKKGKALVELWPSLFKETNREEDDNNDTVQINKVLSVL